MKSDLTVSYLIVPQDNGGMVRFTLGQIEDVDVYLTPIGLLSFALFVNRHGELDAQERMRCFIRRRVKLEGGV